MGMGGYLNDLGLSEQEMYDAQGNSFDPQALLVRMQAGLRQWARGEMRTRHEYPGMDAVANAFGTVQRYVADRGLGGCAHPFPHDLHEQMIRAAAPPDFSATPPIQPPPAAEYGRRG